VTFDVDYALEILPDVLRATVVTVEATFGAMAVALVVGLVLAIARMSRFRALRVAAGGFIEFVRSTPLLVQLFFVFYLLPNYGVSVSALVAGILGLGLHFSAFTAEVYRSGIQGVPRGQWEAATALNLSSAYVWRRVIVPQAIPPVIPALGNYLIEMFKATPLLATITVVEMFGEALAKASESYRYLEPMAMVGLIFFVLSYPSSVLVRRLERVLARH
jgi:polar amino acid transport system permease protein